MKNPVFDKDLTSLLRNCENADLAPLVETILSVRSQTLTIQNAYREHKGDHKAYVDEIVYEITSLGGHSLANLVRGHGISYAEIARNVAAKLGIRTTEQDEIGSIEEKVILKVLTLAYRRMGPEDRSALQELVNLGLDAQEQHYPSNGFAEAEISREIGDGATSLIGDRIHHAIELASNSIAIRRSMISASKLALTRIAAGALGGPLSWAATIGKGLYDLLGPNFAASVALVAHIGLIRQKYEQMELDVLTEAVEVGEIATLAGKIS